ncbi:MAG: hypothetical protein ACYTG4_03770, partial [Planctomycetota bacterium]
TIKWGYRNRRDSGVEAGDARPTFTATSLNLQAHLELDLLGRDTPRNLYEAWAGAWLSRQIRVRLGQMRIPLGTEFASREEHLPLPGYAFVSHLDGRWDTGIMLDGPMDAQDPGDPDRAPWYWHLAATTGHGFGLDGRRRQGQQQSARVVLRPFRFRSGFDPEKPRWTDGFYVGGAYARLADFDDPVVVRTPLRSTVFSTPDLNGRSGSWRHLEAGFAMGPVALGLERTDGAANDVSRPGAAPVDVDQITAWSAMLAVNLTGEPMRWAGGGWRAADPADRSGRWEAAIRYSNADIDRNLFSAPPALIPFSTFATTYDPSTQEVRTFTASLSWIPQPSLRLTLGWVQTIADDELTTFGGTNRDRSWLFRMEFNF